MEKEEQNQINVYDFDKTIYAGDCSIDFWKFSLKRHKKILLCIPYQTWAFFKYCIGIINKTKFKEASFCFLKEIPNINAEISAFWDIHFTNIKNWYLSLKKNSDIIISASPDFLLHPATDKLGVSLIASRVNPLNGMFFSENCRGDEKLNRFKQEYPNTAIRYFYSDSLSDTPLANISQQAFFVSGEDILIWNEYHPSILEKIKQTFLSKEFLTFIFCGGAGTLTNFICSLLISNIFNPTLAYVCGYTLSLIVAYALNAKLIFKESLHILPFFKFVLSYIPNFIILFTFVCVFLNLFGWNKVLVYALAAIFGIPVTFVLVKIFAFRKRTATESG